MANPVKEHKRKIDTLRVAMGVGNWKKAVSIASKFPRLGEHKKAIKQGQDAYTSPHFAKQLGMDPVEIQAAAQAAVVKGWGVRGVTYTQMVWKEEAQAYHKGGWGITILDAHHGERAAIAKIKT